MVKLLRYLLLLSVLVLLPPTAWCADRKTSGKAKEAGGKGKLHSSLLNQCFKPETGVVKEVCTKYTINWKLWSLMGEPVGDYNVSWSLTSITLMDPQRKLNVSFASEGLPKELKKAVSAIELYIDGVATVRAIYAGLNIGHVFYHHFNTGTAVRASAGSSVNVPGSPNWDKLFKPNSACADEYAIFLDANSAKELFGKGIQLFEFKLCPSAGISELTSLETAITKMCEKTGADNKYQFCPKQKPDEKKDSESNMIDDAFSKMEKQTGKMPAAKTGSGENKVTVTDSVEDAFLNMEKQTGKVPTVRTGNIDTEFEKVEAYRIEQERMRIAALKAKQDREEAVQFCTEAMKSEKICIEDACKIEPSKTICTKWQTVHHEPDRSKWKEGHSYIRIPTVTCDSNGPNPKYLEWESCTRNMANKCAHSGTQFSSVDECVSQREKSAR